MVGSRVRPFRVGSSAMQPRILVASNYNDGMALFNALCFEFCQVVADASGADLWRSPEEIVRGKFQDAFATCATERLPVSLGRETPDAPQAADDRAGLRPLLLRVHESQATSRTCRRCAAGGSGPGKRRSSSSKHGRAGSRVERPHLKMLDQFDHVFLFNKASIPNVQAYTSTPCSFLACGRGLPFGHAFSAQSAASDRRLQHGAPLGCDPPPAPRDGAGRQDFLPFRPWLGRARL